MKILTAGIIALMTFAFLGCDQSAFNHEADADRKESAGEMKADAIEEQGEAKADAVKARCSSNSFPLRGFNF